jgi:hypothetical protein
MSRGKRKTLIVGLMVTISIACAGSAYYVLDKKTASVFNEEFQNRSSFKIVQPTNLPDGFSVDKSSAISTRDMLSYKIKTPRGEIAAVQQPKPRQEVTTQLPITSQLQVKAGKVVVSRFANISQTVVSLTTDDSLLFLNTQVALTDDEISTLVNGLEIN